MTAQPKTKGLQKKNPGELAVGMYVAELDRDWSETNFPVQGFYIRSEKAIERLAEEFDHVFVDPRRYDSTLGQVKLKTVPKSGSMFTANTLAAEERLVLGLRKLRDILEHRPRGRGLGV